MNQVLAEALAAALSELPHCSAFVQESKDNDQEYVIYTERLLPGTGLSAYDHLTTFLATCLWVAAHFSPSP